jgi:Spy/CpxP family protein refolding chaperone
MRSSHTRKLLPALLAVAIAPLSTAILADSHGKDGGGHKAYHGHKQEALYEQADLDEATREALQEAREAYHQALRDLQREHRDEVDEILDDDQREALEEARREMHEQWRDKRREAMQERLASLLDEWDLSDEDREALREAREGIYTDLEALREKEFDSREARRQAMRELRDEHHAALAEILDDDQLEELRAAMQPRHGKGRGKGHQGE